MKTFFTKYKHAIPLFIYGIVYLTWFGYLEKTVTKSYQVIHMKLDDYIPFCEYFVIPYYLWFFYVTVTMIYLLFKDKNGYYKNCIFLFTGMTIFLIISTLWPNGQHLRPYILPNENFITQLVRNLYKIDTSTNLWPSIHVYNSIGTHLAIAHNKLLRQNKWIYGGSFILCISIILSTIFIKQHSIFDVITAFIMAIIFYFIVYQHDVLFMHKVSHKFDKISENQEEGS